MMARDLHTARRAEIELLVLEEREQVEVTDAVVSLLVLENPRCSIHRS